jgi:hypothetical protein
VELQAVAEAAAVQVDGNVLEFIELGLGGSLAYKNWAELALFHSTQNPVNWK